MLTSLTDVHPLVTLTVACTAEGAEVEEALEEVTEAEEVKINC